MFGMLCFIFTFFGEADKLRIYSESLFSILDEGSCAHTIFVVLQTQ